jgi:hypothetical protein
MAAGLPLLAKFQSRLTTNLRPQILICATHNLLKLFHYRAAIAPAETILSIIDAASASLSLSLMR